MVSRSLGMRQHCASSADASWPWKTARGSNSAETPQPRLLASTVTLSQRQQTAFQSSSLLSTTLPDCCLMARMVLLHVKKLLCRQDRTRQTRAVASTEHEAVAACCCGGCGASHVQSPLSALHQGRHLQGTTETSPLPCLMTSRKTCLPGL